MVFENRVRRRIFGPKREEVAGGWRRLHHQGFHNLYSSPNFIRVNKSSRMRWTGHVMRMGNVRNAYEVLVGKVEGKRSLGIPRSSSEDNVRKSFKKIGWEGVYLMRPSQDMDQWPALVNTVMNLRVP
jgi:hypothetical protein